MLIGLPSNISPDWEEKTTPYAQAETVLNYEEVAARLAPTAYAHLLH